MSRMLVRLIVAIVIVAAAQLALEAARLGPGETLPPRLPLTAFSTTFESWDSKDESLNPEVFNNTAADKALSRIYHDAAGHVVSFFMAQYSDVQSGLYHNPFNCYRSSGFTNLSSSKVSIACKSRPEVEVWLSVWEQDNKKYMVMYWYEIANQVAFERGDGMKLQMAFLGKRKWAPMYKVLMQTPITGTVEESKAMLTSLAGKVRDFLGEASPPMDGK